MTDRFVYQSGNSVATSFDQENRLTGYSSTATYTYNGEGLRTSKKVNGVAEAYVWDMAEGNPVVLADGSTSYVTGPGGAPLEQVSGRTVYYYHLDQIQSVRAMTDSRGSTVDTFNYDAYGNLASSTGTVANPFRYAGQYDDLESGFYYLRARYYDPATEQFITPDPVSETTRQPYIYAEENPLNSADPTGLAPPGRSCDQLLAELLFWAKKAWQHFKQAAIDERNGCDEYDHAKEARQYMNKVRDLYNKYVGKGCDLSKIPQWVIDLLEGNEPGADDPEPWSSLQNPWPVLPGPISPPTWIPIPGWPPKAPAPIRPPIPIPIIPVFPLGVA